MSMASTKQTRGRQKITMKRIENDDDRLITFSKRRSGIYKKSSELVTLCGAEVAVLVFSPGGKAFSFGNPSIESVISRFLGQNTPQKDTMTHPLVEAHRKVRINELNQQLSEMVGRLDAEKERAKVLKQIFRGRVGEYRGWWDVPLDEVNLEELKEMLRKLEELHGKLVRKIDEGRANDGASSSMAPMFSPQTGFMGGFGTANTANEVGSSSFFPQGDDYGHGFSL